MLPGSCRFYELFSSHTILAIQEHGVFKGAYLWVRGENAL